MEFGHCTTVFEFKIIEITAIYKSYPLSDERDL